MSREQHKKLRKFNSKDNEGLWILKNLKDHYGNTNTFKSENVGILSIIMDYTGDSTYVKKQKIEQKEEKKSKEWLRRECDKLINKIFKKKLTSQEYYAYEMQLLEYQQELEYRKDEQDEQDKQYQDEQYEDDYCHGYKCCCYHCF